MSLRASPAWNSTRFWAPRAIAPPIRLTGPEAVGAADRVGRGEPERQPAEVDQRREDVAVEGEDAGPRARPRSSPGRTRRRRSGRSSRSSRSAPRARTGSRAACGTRGCRRDPCLRRGSPGSAPSSAAATAAPRSRRARPPQARPAAPAAPSAPSGERRPATRCAPSATASARRATIVHASKAANVPSSSARRISADDREHRLDHPRGGAGPARSSDPAQAPGGVGERREDQQPARSRRAGRRRRRACAPRPGR